MPYGPQNQYMGPQLLAQGIKDQASIREQRKENDALVKGFMQMHESSPELQRLLPINDWGEVAPNQIKGWLQGLETQQQQQAQQVAAQEQMQQQAQQQMQQQALAQILNQVGGGGQASPAAQFLQATGGQGMDPKEIMGVLRGLQGARGQDLNNDGSMDVWFGPNGNQVNTESMAGADGVDYRQQKQLESLMTRPLGGGLMEGTIRLGDYINNTYDENGYLKPNAVPSPVAEATLEEANRLRMNISGKPVFVPKVGNAPGPYGRIANQVRGVFGAVAGGQDQGIIDQQAAEYRQQQAGPDVGKNKVMSIGEFEQEFEKEIGRKPTDNEIAKARNKYWR